MCPSGVLGGLGQRARLEEFAGSGALELATGDAASKVEQEQAACDAACLSTRKKLEAAVLTSAVVLDVSPSAATVRVTSVGLAGAPKINLIRLMRAESLWKASELKPDDGVPFPEPVAIPLRPTQPATSAEPGATPAAPGGSAAPHAVHPAPAASH